MDDPISAQRGQGFPVRNCIFARKINGHVTNFVWNLYLDHLLLIITQIGAVGTVFAARQDTSPGIAGDGLHCGEGEGGPGAGGRGPTYSTPVLLGRRDEPGLELAARQLAAALGEAGCGRPVTLCLGLKDSSPATVRQLVAAVRQDNVWGAA